MKPLSKFLLQALSLMFLLFISCYFPGTEKGNLRTLTMLYANREKTEGQKVRFGGIDRKDYQEVEGIRRLYAETHYYLIYPSGQKVRKDFFLLMSEDGDSLIDFTTVKGFKPWCPPKDVRRKDQSGLELFIRDAHREMGIPDEEPFP